MTEGARGMEQDAFALTKLWGILDLHCCQGVLSLDLSCQSLFRRGGDPTAEKPLVREKEADDTSGVLYLSRPPSSRPSSGVGGKVIGDRKGYWRLELVFGVEHTLRDGGEWGGIESG